MNFMVCFEDTLCIKELNLFHNLYSDYRDVNKNASIFLEYFPETHPINADRKINFVSLLKLFLCFFVTDCSLIIRPFEIFDAQSHSSHEIEFSCHRFFDHPSQSI